MKRSAVSWAFCAFLILPPQVVALPDDSATSQLLMPRPSSSVTIPKPLRALWRVLTICGLWVRELADASHLFDPKESGCAREKPDVCRHLQADVLDAYGYPSRFLSNRERRKFLLFRHRAEL